MLSKSRHFDGDGCRMRLWEPTDAPNSVHRLPSISTREVANYKRLAAMARDPHPLTERELEERACKRASDRIEARRLVRGWFDGGVEV